MKKYVCDVCGWEYDPAVGDPDAGIEPGVAFEDLPEDFVCPLCGVGKDEFSPVDWFHPASTQIYPVVNKFSRRVYFCHIGKLQAGKELSLRLSSKRGETVYGDKAFN